MENKIATSRWVPASLLLAATLALGACADTRKAIGWEKSTPDEFRVVSRAPLTLPPDFGLRPPAPGTTRPQESSPQESARAAVFGAERPANAAASNAALSAGERQLLGRAGAERADASIRDTIDRETQSLADADRTFVDRLIFWQPPQAPAGSELDAGRESQRLREAQAAGRAANEGEVATIRTRKRGWLEGIF
jgi:hypothetical protein